MRCRGRASRFRARVDIGSTLPRPALRTRGSTPPGRTGPWRRWQPQASRRRMRALLSLERVKGIEPLSKAWEALDECSTPTPLTPQILRGTKSTINAANLDGGRDTGVSVEGFGRVTWIVEYRVQRCSTERPH